MRSPLPSVLVSLVAAAGLMAAYAQSPTPSSADTARQLAYEAAMGVRAIGKRWDRDAFAETIRLYTAVHREVPWPGVLAPETHAYGEDPRQTLSLFRPEQAFSEPGPVFLFLHGNGLGDSAPTAPGSDGLIYSHLGKLGASFGGLGVIASYRDAESADVVSGIEDLRQLLSWLTRNVARFGGDPDTIVLLAAGEGAAHAARYLFARDGQTAAGPGLAAAVLISGLFGDQAPGLTDAVDAYDGPRVPLALWSGEHDPAPTEIGVAELYAQLCRKYRDCPAFAQLQGHNPISHVLTLGTADTGVMNALIGFYHTVR